MGVHFLALMFEPNPSFFTQAQHARFALAL